MDFEYILYVKETCAWCTKATDALTLRKKHFKKISLDQNLRILEDLKEAYNWKTVPMVFRRFDEDKFVLLGGYTELYDHLESSNE